MRNPSTLGYEGAANLLEGFRVAACQSRGSGVLVRLPTFPSRGYGAGEGSVAGFG